MRIVQDTLRKGRSDAELEDDLGSTSRLKRWAARRALGAEVIDPAYIIGYGYGYGEDYPAGDVGDEFPVWPPAYLAKVQAGMHDVTPEELAALCADISRSPAESAAQAREIGARLQRLLDDRTDARY